MDKTTNQKIYNALIIILVVAFIAYAGYRIGHNAGYKAGWYGAINEIRSQAGDSIYTEDSMQEAFNQGWDAAIKTLESDAPNTVLFYGGDYIDLDDYCGSPSGEVDTSCTEGILLDNIENSLRSSNTDY